MEGFIARFEYAIGHFLPIATTITRIVAIIVAVCLEVILVPALLNFVWFVLQRFERPWMMRVFRWVKWGALIPVWLIIQGCVTYAFLPEVGMGVAAAVILALIYICCSVLHNKMTMSESGLKELRRCNAIPNVLKGWLSYWR